MNEAIILGIIALLIGFSAICYYFQWQQERLHYLKRKAFEIYVQTGKKTEAFNLIPYRLVKAAERQRRTCITERLKDSKDFVAFCVCPYCGFEALHFIGSVIMTGISRECVECRKGWWQK